MAPRSLRRLLVGAVVLPHEYAHALPAALAGLDYEVALFPEWEGAAAPLGRFRGAADEATPTALIRLIALAPLPTFLAVAAGIRAAFAPPLPAALVAVVACSWWGTLSAGDLAVAARPAAARRGEPFVVPVAGGERVAADAATVATTLTTGAILLV